MSNRAEPDPAGATVTDYCVLGQEIDSGRRWIGADLELRIPPLGRFFVNVVTKGHYRDETLEDALHDLDHPDYLLGGAAHAAKEPFVLNDEMITEEVLKRKFQGRKVEQDLAASLWFQGGESQSDTA